MEESPLDSPKPKRKSNTSGLLPPIKKGETRNPTGINGWDKARQKIKELLQRR